MSVLVVTVLFFVIVIAWFALAFVPAVRELRAGVDARALPVAADGRVSPSYFADRFRRVLTDRLAGPVQEVHASGKTLIGSIGEEERFVVLPAHHARIDADENGAVDALVLAVGDLEIPDGSAMLREVYVEGGMRAGTDTLLRATLAEGGIELDARTVSLRWIHSGRDLQAGPQCRLYGRASAKGTLSLDVGCTFEKLHASRIAFGPPPPLRGSDESVQRRTVSADALGDRTETSGGRTRYAGDLELPDHVRFTGDLVVTGRLRVGPFVRIDGSVKARSIEIDDDVEIFGALVSAGDLRIGARARIHGPVLAEGDALVGPNGTIGTRDLPSTLRARRVDVYTGCVVHGAVWTLDGGGEVRS